MVGRSNGSQESHCRGAFLFASCIRLIRKIEWLVAVEGVPHLQRWGANDLPYDNADLIAPDPNDEDYSEDMQEANDASEPLTEQEFNSRVRMAIASAERLLTIM